MDNAMPFSLDGRVALVTGSSTGLGKAVAFGLARSGARVALNYFNNEERAAETFGEFQAEGFEGVMLRGDVSDESAVNALCGEVVEKLGEIDILVVNATPDQPQMPIEEFTWEHFQTMIDFFIKSPYLLTRAVLPHMKENRWGRIINITSEVFQRSIGNFSAYVSAKGGQIGFTRSMATELAPFNITVNLVAPGWIPVERHENDPQDQKDGYREMIPMDRWGVPDDVAGAVAYYASEEAGFVTGQTICVNGGMSPW
jgi:3-oxoacyl-[acyl-carrier protein] reductase